MQYGSDFQLLSHGLIHQYLHLFSAAALSGVQHPALEQPWKGSAVQLCSLTALYQDQNYDNNQHISEQGRLGLSEAGKVVSVARSKRLCKFPAVCRHTFSWMIESHYWKLNLSKGLESLLIQVTMRTPAGFLTSFPRTDCCL